MKPVPKARRITLRIEAYTDPAGKYDATAPLNGNEDNFFVSDHGDADGVVIEPQHGVLIAVADGMGGLNAGEVASGLTIDTVTEAFTPEKIAAMASHNGPTRQVYLEHIIRQADARIKAAQRQNAAQANMGSTIVLAWLMDNELVVSWCGDSRAYIYNAATGLRLISHDHSYVQELVDSGAITYDQAFDHPQNNIVTRSLGDPQHDAKPDSVRLTMSKGDILMVCSDGLTGVLRDKKAYDAKNNLLPEMNMEDIFRAASTLKECREKLWEAASKSGWYDNVTAVLCEMTEGPQAPVVTPSQPAVARPAAPVADQAVNKSKADARPKQSQSGLWIALFVIFIGVAGLLAYLFADTLFQDKKEPVPVEVTPQEDMELNQEEGEEPDFDSEWPSVRDHFNKPHSSDNAAAPTDTRKPDTKANGNIEKVEVVPVPEAGNPDKPAEQQTNKTDKKSKKKDWDTAKKTLPNKQSQEPAPKPVENTESN